MKQGLVSIALLLAVFSYRLRTVTAGKLLFYPALQDYESEEEVSEEYTSINTGHKMSDKSVIDNHSSTANQPKVMNFPEDSSTTESIKGKTKKNRTLRLKLLQPSTPNRLVDHTTARNTEKPVKNIVWPGEPNVVPDRKYPLAIEPLTDRQTVEKGLRKMDHISTNPDEVDHGMMTHPKMDYPEIDAELPKAGGLKGVGMSIPRTTHSLKTMDSSIVEKGMVKDRANIKHRPPSSPASSLLQPEELSIPRGKEKTMENLVWSRVEKNASKKHLDNITEAKLSLTETRPQKRDHVLSNPYVYDNLGLDYGMMNQQKMDYPAMDPHPPRLDNPDGLDYSQMKEGNATNEDEFATKMRFFGDDDLDLTNIFEVEKPVLEDKKNKDGYPFTKINVPQEWMETIHQPRGVQTFLEKIAPDVFGEIL